MQTFEIICLANSLKHGGRCIAGIKTDGSGWLRPVSGRGDGTLYEEHYTLANGEQPKLFDILQIPCQEAYPSEYHPEDWAITSKKWQHKGFASIKQLNKLLKKEFNVFNHSRTLLRSQSDRLQLDDLKQDPLNQSLCLIRPENIHWSIQTDEFSEKRKFRAIFELQQTEYDLSITDPLWQHQLNQLVDGEYSSEAVIENLGLENYEPENFLLTISLSGPIQPKLDQPHYCFKLIAAVMNRGSARVLLAKA